MPKKTKAIKKTDIKGNKPWLKKVNSSTYKVDSRETNKVILIVCEGQTEKLYFESFPVLTLDVTAVDLKGQSKLALIEATNNILKIEPGKYDAVWCVFDMDVRQGAKEFADFDNAIHQGVASNLNIAYSNDSFELWFYLHYQYSEQKNLRTFYYQFLSDEWNMNYVKEGKKRSHCLEIYEKLIENSQSSQDFAIKNAKKLFNKHKHLPYHQQNPVTTVYQLVEFLNRNLRK